MKTRSKLLLAAVSLLTVSIAATATSAYAWYAANRQVEATVNKLGVQSTSGSLKIEHDTSIKQTKTDSKLEQTGEDLVFNSTTTLTDVSSKGDGTFVKPKWDATGSTGSANCVGEYKQEGENPNKQVTLYGSTKAYGVVSLGVKFTNKGVSNVTDDLVVYLDPTVTLTATNSTNKMSSASVVNSARFSICEVDEKGAFSSVYLYGNPKSKPTEEATNEVNKYVSAAATKSITTEGVATDNVVDQSNLFATKSQRVTDPTAEGNNAKSKGYLCTIPAQGTKRYLITMWVEGTDKDCVFGAEGNESFEVSGLSLKLGFYALTKAPSKTQS